MLLFKMLCFRLTYFNISMTLNISKLPSTSLNNDPLFKTSLSHAKLQWKQPTNTTTFSFIYFYSFTFFWGSVFLCSPVCSVICEVEEASLKSRDLPTTAPWALGLKMCSPMTGMATFLDKGDKVYGREGTSLRSEFSELMLGSKSLELGDIWVF